VRDPMTAAESARYQRMLVNVVLVFLVLAILSELPGWPPGNPIFSAHERSFFAAIGVSAALFQRRVGVAALIVFLAGIVFLQYPAATWVLVTVAALLTGYATSNRGRRSGGLVLVLFAVALLGFGLTQVQGGQSSLAKSYFSVVSKTDNTNTRSQLWTAAQREIAKRPLVGSAFTGNFTVPNVDRVITDLPASARIAPHNDYLQLMVLGGLFAAFLFVGFIVSANVIVIRRTRWFLDERRSAEASFARVLLIGFNAALAAAFFNPVISQIGIGAAIYLLYALMMTVRPVDPMRAVRLRGSRPS
jgi:O-antigen ligase